MECRDYERRRRRMARGSCAVGLQLNFSGAPPRLARKPARAALQPPARGAGLCLPPDVHCLSDMDEISYWIHTKRAPCLMNYDNIIKKQSDQAQCSNIDLTLATETDTSPRKNKRKRKMPLLEESMSSGRQQNVYFDGPQKNPVNNCKADVGSDVDFNHKNTVKTNAKRARLQKSKTLFHKNSKVVTSTPKVNVKLRRSVRQAQLHNTLGNSSFEIFGATNGTAPHLAEPDQRHVEALHKTEARERATNDQTHTSRRVRPRNTTLYYTLSDDYSDVSGFTANYIRSTKVQANNKTPRKPRCKPAANLPQDTNIQSAANDRVNKVDTLPEPKTLNCSTSSSHNVINLDTPKGASIPKLNERDQCIDTKDRTKSKTGRKSKVNLNVSFQSQSSGTSRYPKRLRNHIGRVEIPSPLQQSNKACLDFDNSDNKVSRTRRGRSAALNSQLRESVLTGNNCTEQSNCSVSPNDDTVAKGSNKRAPKAGSRKTVHRRRHKSGFSACFSDSDDSLPLIQKKFFCD